MNTPNYPGLPYPKNNMIIHGDNYSYQASTHLVLCPKVFPLYDQWSLTYPIPSTYAEDLNMFFLIHMQSNYMYTHKLVYMVY